MSIKCFDGLPGLKAKVISLVNDKTSEKEAGIKVILEEHKKVHKELNDFRTLLGLPAEAYAAPDTSVEIDIIKEEYENKINAAKTGTQTTAAAPAANPKAQGQTTQGATPSSTAGTGKPNAAATAPVLTEKQKTIARLKAAREKNKKTKPPVQNQGPAQGETIVADGKNAATLQSKPTDSRLKKKIISDTKKAISVLKKIVPNLKVAIYDTNEAFVEATGVNGRGRGGYKGGVIHINLEVMEEDMRKGATSNTLIHEMVHPILNIIAPTGSKEMSDLFDQLVELKSVPGVKGILRYGKSQKDFFEANGNAREQKSAVGIGKTEAVVEFIAQLANGDISLEGQDRSVLKKIADFLKSFVKMIGGKEVSIKNVSDLKKLAEQISGAFESGRTIAEANIIRKGSDSSIQLHGEYDVSGKEKIIVGRSVPTRNTGDIGFVEESLAAARSYSKALDSTYLNRAIGFATGSFKGPASGRNNISFPYSNLPLSKRIDKLKSEIKSTTSTSKEALIKKKKLWGKMLNLCDQVYAEFKDVLKGNITAVYKSYDKDFAKRSKVWYEGANRIAQNIASTYDISLEGASAIIAALSPQTPWFANVSAAYRVINIMKNHATMPVTSEMFANAVELTAGKDFSEIAFSVGKNYAGKSLADVVGDPSLTEETVSAFLRVIDENIHSKSVPIVSPEGKMVSISSDRFAWGSPKELVKAMLIYVDPSFETISSRLGNGNKVRNFYNNIANPNSEGGETTVDTHAINVGFLNLISSEDASSLGLFNNDTNKFSMMYTVLKEAYQEVAKEQGYLPREMQSITWEAMRLLVSDKQKSDTGNREFVNNIWEEKQKNNISHEEAIGKVIGRFSYDRPDWDRATEEGIGGEILQGDGYSLYKKDGDVSDLRGQQDDSGQDTSDMAEGNGWRPIAGMQFQSLGDLRDNKHFKFADLSYPDVVFGDVTTDTEADIAIGFYKKIINKFNKEFGRDLKTEVSKGKNGNFSVSVEYETGLKPKYFAYPTKTMGEHEIVDTLTNEVPLTSLRHELIHEMLVKHITNKFERINNLDQSASAASIEEVQRNRAYNYTLEDVFFERVVENIERMPDGVDTFNVDTYGTDVTNRLQEELKGKVSKEKVMAKLSELLEGANPWLQDALTKIFDRADYTGITDVRDMAQEVGKKFKQRFDVAKDIFPKELQEKVLEFTNLFNDEYQGVQTRLAKQIKNPDLKTFEIGYAPFREGNIKTLDGSKKAFENKKYQQWISMAKQFANDLGISIDAPVPNVGIYGATSNDMEASALVSVTGDLQDVETFAALMGTLAPDTQHSVMMNTYDRKGEDREHKLVFKTREAAEDFLSKKKLYGVSDISFDPATNTATILDIKRYNSIFDFAKFISNHGQDIIEHEDYRIRNTFIEEPSYKEIIQRGRDKINGQDRGEAGQNLLDVYKLAISRLERQSGNRSALPQSKKKALTRSVFDYVAIHGKAFGLSFPKSVGEKVKFSDETSAKIYEAYSKLAIDNSSNKEVAAAYEQLVKEVDAQYRFITEDLGMAVTFMDNDPYDDSVHMMSDVYDNNHIKVFKGGEPHAFLDAKDKNGLSANEKFRAVHDYFGHAVEGNQFGKRGEEAAWMAHSKMFSPLAQRAMSTETRGQNSWVNNSSVNNSAMGKFAEGNDLVKSGKVTEGNKLIKEAQSEFQFADQKVDLLPVELTQPMQMQGELDTVKENIRFTESKIEDLESEILIEKSDLKEEIARIKSEIAKVRESKLSKGAKEEKIEDLKYEIEDAQDSAEATIESYKDDIANEKDDLKRYNRELKKADKGGMQFQLDPTSDFGITDDAYDQALDSIIEDIEVNDIADIDAITNAVVKLRKQFGAAFKEDAFVDHIINIIDGKDAPIVTGIRHELTAAARREFGFNDYVKTPVTDAEVEAAANAALPGYDFDKLISKIERGVPPNAVETILMAKYIASAQAAVEANPTNANIAAARRVIEALDIIGSNQGREFRLRKFIVVEDDSLMGYFQQEMEANGVGELTEQQKKDVAAERDALLKAKAEYDDSRNKDEAEDSEKKAKSNVGKTSKKTTKTKQDFEAERKSVIEHMRQKLKDVRGESTPPSDTQMQFQKTNPLDAELRAAAPDALKMVRIFVEEGVTDFDTVIDNLYDVMRDNINGISRQDVIDVVANEYRENKVPRSDISEQLQTLRNHAQLLNRLDDLENGIEPTEAKKVKKNKELEKLRKQIRNTPLARDLAVRANTLRQIEKLENDLATGNFLNKAVKPEPVKLSQKTTDAKDKLIKLKEERHLRLIKAKYAARTKWQVAGDMALELLNVPRTVMSSMDFSAPLRQGIIPTISHPLLAAKAFVDMFRSAGSQKFFDRWFFDLRESADYSIMEDSGLYIADPHDVRLSEKEEMFMNNLAEKIPGIGRLIKGSERAYVMYLNKMRVDVFRQGIEAFQSDGKTLELNESLYKGLASYVNNATGRGGIGVKGTKWGDTLASATPVLNGLFFSPRLIASRLNLLNPLYYAKLPQPVLMSALADMGKFIIFGTSVLALFALGGGDDEDDFKVETDPRSTDFGKIRKGDTRYDIWGGFQQYVRLLSQFLSGSAKSSKTGVVRKLDGQGIFGTTRMDIVTRFIRGKFAPVPAGIANIGYGKDMIGNEVEVGDEVGKFITPLVIKDMVSAMKIKDIFDVKQTLQDIKENGAAAVFTVGLPASLGVGVSVIDLTAKEIDDIPGIGQSTEDRLKDKGIKSLDDLVKKRSTLKALKFEDKNGKMKKIFDAKTLKVIDSVINQMKIKKK